MHERVRKRNTVGGTYGCADPEVGKQSGSFTAGNCRRPAIMAGAPPASPKDIARTMGLGVREVEEVLAKCERALRSALRIFRESGGYPTMDESLGAAAMNWPQSHRDAEDERNKLNSSVSLCLCGNVKG